MRNKILIYGSGAIGSHLCHILNSKDTEIYLLFRKKKLNYVKKNGINLIIKNNSKTLNKIKILPNKNIHFISDLSKLKKINFDFIFVTIKLINKIDLDIKKIKRLMSNKTSVVMPCTILPNWWLNQYSKYKINQIIPINKIIGMTMWVSGIMKENNVTIKHTQRGYPLKEIDKKNKLSAYKLRRIIRNKSKSPLVKNIYSEIYLKVINSFAFNLVAIKYDQNNLLLSNNQDAIKDITSIMKEFDNIVKEKGLKITQSIKSRINQTLSSKKHTMSMLTDFRNGKKIEIINQWESLIKIDKSIKNKIKFSKKIYESTIKLIRK